MRRLLIHIGPSICLGFITQLILHEIGHLLFGLITGWELLSIQIHKFVLKKVNSKLRLITVGENHYRCIMYPGSLSSGAMLYTMGGCILNLVSAIVGFICIFFGGIQPILWVYLWCFSAFGAGFFIMNGTARLNRICNDRACHDLLKGKKHTRLCHNAQFLIAKHLAIGLSYGQIKKDLICLCPETADNDIEAYQAVLEYYYHLDRGNYIGAGKALNKIKLSEKLSREIIDTVQMELIYDELIKWFVASEAKTDNFSEYDEIIKQCKNKDVHLIRIRAATDAYAALRKGHPDDAMIILSKSINKLRKLKCVYEGEKVFCIRQLEHIIELIKDKGISIYNN